MPKWLPIVLVSVCLLVSPVGALELGLVTGSTNGTYYKIGEELQKLLSEKLTPKGDLTLKVYPSSGSLANVLQVYQTRGVHLGIVQSDVLAYIQALSENQELQRIARKLKLVFPLFNEEVHVLAARDSDIKSFTDLAGKTVAVGPKDSGTYLTASFLFELTQEKPARALELSYQDALEELKKGAIDALIWVGGAPLALLQNNVSADDKLRLVPLTDKSLVEFYTPASIPARTYSWQEEEVPTIAVLAVVMAFDYKGEACEPIGRLAKLVYDHIAGLRDTGHAKWRAVNLEVPLPGWERYGCVERVLRGSSGVPPSAGSEPRNPVTEALKNMLKIP